MATTESSRERTAPDPGLVIVDKPAGMTSHDVVSRCRRFFGTRKVGHAGTLDPAATGVLIIGIERGTKLMGHLALSTKSYQATIRLGAATSTDDAEGDVLSSADASALSAADLQAPIAALTGDIMQKPARVSAIKINGRRAHELVRAGQEVDLPARPVRVDRFDVLDTRHAGTFFDCDVEVDCSSGTYIRSLARDLGQALGVGGHLTALRRTRVGDFDLRHARTLEQLEHEPRLSLGLDEAVLSAFAHREITAEQAAGLKHGRWLDAVGQRDTVVAVDPDGVPVALLQESGKRAESVFLVHPQ